tara:strand:+ start:472 stop:714 length:243 start_codon:yes stop_codon:yes gene_type:complete
MDWINEIIYILEKDIRYDLSSQLAIFAEKHGLSLDPLWMPTDLDQRMIQDRFLDKQMDKESIPEETPTVGQTKDGFFYLK